MKLLLTSSGISNKSLEQAFFQLLIKPVSEIKLAFIDTASKVEKDTSFVDQDLKKLHLLGLKNISRIDIAEPQDNWIAKLIQADVVYVEGGNTFYLLDRIRASGLDMTLSRILKDKVYVGVSAGSILVTPSIAISGVEPGDPNDVGMTDFTGLGWVDFEVSPHTPDLVSKKDVAKYAKTINRELYAIDDGKAVLCVENQVTVVGEGFAQKFN